jgi:intergrase/recombinase
MQSKPAFVAIDREYVALSKMYNDAYERALPATKAKWHAEIDPAFDACDAALDAWRASINQPGAVTNKAAFDTAYRALVGVLMKYGIIVQEVK